MSTRLGHYGLWENSRMGAIVGIDPGISGAVAFVTAANVACHDMPTIEIRGKRKVDPAGLREILACGGIDMVVLEHVQGVQGTGSTSAFSFGRSFGVVEGVVSGLGLPLTLVRPQAWTKALGVSRDKGQHRDAARRLWPSCAGQFARVKDDGRADAALLCHWFLRHGTALTMF